MCRRMVCFAVLFGIISFTSVHAVVIDDFESYDINPQLQAVWGDTSNPLSTAVATVRNTNVAEGARAMDAALNFNGGWLNPGDPLDLSTSDHAGIGRELDGSIDFESGGELRMSLLINDSEWVNANFMIIELTGLAGDGVTNTWSQVLIPTEQVLHLIIPPPWGLLGAIPATIGFDLGDVPRLGDGVWTDIVINEDHHVFWGDPHTAHDSLTGISIQFCGGGEDLTGIAKMDGTDVVYPKMSVTANVGVDNIYYVPEPLTISFLGIGGLALIRRKR